MEQQELIDAAKARYKELDALLRQANVYRSELDQLRSFLATVDHIQAILDPNSPKPEHSPIRYKSNGDGDGARRTFMADRIASILQRKGALHIRDLMREMTADGWKGTGRPSNNYASITTTMNRWRGDRFVKVGPATWDILRDYDKNHGEEA